MMKTKKAIQLVVAIFLATGLATAGIMTYFARHQVNVKVPHQAIEIDGHPYNKPIYDNVTAVPGDTFRVYHRLDAYSNQTLNFTATVTFISGITVTYYIDGALMNVPRAIIKGSYNLTGVFVLSPNLTRGNYSIQTSFKIV